MGRYYRGVVQVLLLVLVMLYHQCNASITNVTATPLTGIPSTGSEEAQSTKTITIATNTVLASTTPSSTPNIITPKNASSNQTLDNNMDGTTTTVIKQYTTVATVSLTSPEMPTESSTKGAISTQSSTTPIQEATTASKVTMTTTTQVTHTTDGAITNPLTPPVTLSPGQEPSSTGSSKVVTMTTESIGGRTKIRTEASTESVGYNITTETYVTTATPIGGTVVKIPLVWIIAAAGGGGALVLLVITVLIVCACRRKKHKSRQISMRSNEADYLWVAGDQNLYRRNRDNSLGNILPELENFDTGPITSITNENIFEVDKKSNKGSFKSGSSKRGSSKKKNDASNHFQPADDVFGANCDNDSESSDIPMRSFKPIEYRESMRKTSRKKPST